MLSGGRDGTSLAAEVGRQFQALKLIKCLKKARRSHCRRSLRPLACWDYGFESHGGKGCLCVVNVVCCQGEVSATGWSLVQRSRVWSKNLVNEEAVAHWGLLRQRKGPLNRVLAEISFNLS